jgi:hypothetical protein
VFKFQAQYPKIRSPVIENRNVKGYGQTPHPRTRLLIKISNISRLILNNECYKESFYAQTCHSNDLIYEGSALDTATFIENRV